MATIKIYDSDNSFEFANADEYEEHEMMITIDHKDHDSDYLYFSISKEDARELIKYLKEQFHI